MRSMISVRRKSAKRDPAPSRVAYRLNRLWLTPEFHRFLKLGVPMILLTGMIFAIFSDPLRRETMHDYLVELRRSIEERPEFMVDLMAIDGASDELALDIREVLPVDLPASSFDLDLEAMRQHVESLDAVERVDMQVMAGGILQITVEERVPAVIWRSRDGLELLDADGRRVAALMRRTMRPDLLLVAGDDADLAVAEALQLARATGPLRHRMIGLMRISALRWDVLLDGGHRIMLPETGALPALDRAVALADAQRLFDPGKVARIDFRNPDRPILRLADGAVIDRGRVEPIDVKD
ncbi:MAG: cell division protein FtsQ/DivIB [Pseudomonadota bacterium]